MTREMEAELERLQREKAELLRFVRDVVAASDEAYDRRGGGKDLYDFGAYWYQQGLARARALLDRLDQNDAAGAPGP